jgi:hypothetical protein
MQIRILGSVLLTNASGYGSGCGSVTLVHLHHSSKSHKTAEIKVFLSLFAWRCKDPDMDLYWWQTDHTFFILLNSHRYQGTGVKMIAYYVQGRHSSLLVIAPSNADTVRYNPEGCNRRKLYYFNAIDPLINFSYTFKILCVIFIFQKMVSAQENIVHTSLKVSDGILVPQIPV